jgi:4-hydroxy-tetrahydrodipicolinate synthase
MRMTRVPKTPAPVTAALRGSMTALVTPFRGGRLDESRLFALCEAQVKAGTSALILCGSTGEAAALSQTEQSRVIAIGIEASLGRIPIVAGCAAPATEAAVAVAAAAARSRATALLCAPPPYSRPTQDGIVAHVRAVALATELPVILYDVPGRTGVAIADTTVARLFDAGLIVGLKDATADIARPPRLRALCGPGLIQLSGDDATAAAHRAMGGEGCISVTANLVPALCARLHHAWDIGDRDEFARLRHLLAPLHEALFAESNPIPIKAALDLAGLCEAEVRLPLTPAVATTTARLAALLPALLEAETAGLTQPRPGHAARPRLSLVG